MLGSVYCIKLGNPSIKNFIYILITTYQNSVAHRGSSNGLFNLRLLGRVRQVQS